MSNLRQIIIIGFLFCFNTLSAQEYYRVSTNFTVKIKKSDGSQNLTKGKVYYDKNYNELIYKIFFPEKEKWILKDTSLIKTRNDTMYAKASIPSINEFTVFNLALNSNLTDFGLKNSIYEIIKVEKKNGLTLSYWRVPEQTSTMLNYVVVAKKDNRLESVAMVGNNSNIISRQFFRNYFKIGAFEFPRQIVQIIYDNTGGKNYQVTDFEHIQVNEWSNNNLYRNKLKTKSH